MEEDREMKPNHTTARVRASLLAPGVAALLLLVALSSARAGAQTPQLIITGGPGIPGGTATATLSLAGDTANAASSADVDINFPNNVLSFSPPVTQNCMIASRLSTTHEVAGHLNPAGDTVILSIIVQGTPVQIPHLGDGPLATCNFGVLPGVPTGTAALTLQNAALFDNMGNPIDVTAVNGSIVISEATPTPTVTVTHLASPTATPTHQTPGGTATATPTVTGGGGGGTATATPTTTSGTPGTPTATHTGGTPSGTGTPTVTHGTPSGTGTPTATHGTPSGTGTPTATHGTPGATATRTGGAPPHFKDSDSCTIVPVADSSARGTLALLLAPAVLLWARRRRF
jgi:hypothetical protein